MGWWKDIELIELDFNIFIYKAAYLGQVLWTYQYTKQSLTILSIRYLLIKSVSWINEIFTWRGEGPNSCKPPLWSENFEKILLPSEVVDNGVPVGLEGCLASQDKASVVNQEDGG